MCGLINEGAAAECGGGAGNVGDGPGTAGVADAGKPTPPGQGVGGTGGWGCATLATAVASPPEILGIPPLPDDSVRRIAWICSGVSAATSAASAVLASWG